MSYLNLYVLKYAFALSWLLSLQNAILIYEMHIHRWTLSDDLKLITINWLYGIVTPQVTLAAGMVSIIRWWCVEGILPVFSRKQICECFGSWFCYAFLSVFQPQFWLLIHAMSIDFALLSTFAPFWIYIDMTARKWWVRLMIVKNFRPIVRCSRGYLRRGLVISMEEEVYLVGCGGLKLKGSIVQRRRHVLH